MKQLLFYMLTSIEFLLTAVGIFICSFLAIWWVDTEIQNSRKEGFDRGFKLGKVKSEVEK